MSKTQPTRAKAEAAEESLWSWVLSLKPDALGYTVLTPTSLNAMSDQIGMSRTWWINVIRRWEKDAKVKIVYTKGSGRSGQQVAGVYVKDTDRGRTAEDPIKERLLNHLLKIANRNGKVPQGDMDKVAGALGINGHDVMKVMFDLRRAGKVNFREDRNGSATWLKEVRITAGWFNTQGTAIVGKRQQPWLLCDECWWELRYHLTDRVDDPDDGRCPTPPKPGSPAGRRLADIGMANAQKDAPDAKLGDHPGHTITAPAKRSHPVGIAGRVNNTQPSPVTTSYRCSECDPPRDFQYETNLIQHKRDAHPRKAFDADAVAEENLIEDEAAGLVPVPERWKDEGPKPVPENLHGYTCVYCVGNAKGERPTWPHHEGFRFHMNTVHHGLPWEAAFGGTSQTFDQSKYPAITAMYDGYYDTRNQRAKMETAINALLDAGEDHTAETLRTKMENQHAEPSKLAQEIVLLVEAIGGYDPQEETDGS